MLQAKSKLSADAGQTNSIARSLILDILLYNIEIEIIRTSKKILKCIIMDHTSW